MAAVAILMIFLAMILGSDAAWCICRQDASNPALQKTIDYACGAGADCSPILQNGACYNPNTVLSHCSYAANSYYQRKGQAQGACDFSGTATLITTDPSTNGCSYPATQSAAGTSGSSTGGSTQNPGSGSSSNGLSPPQGGTGSVGGVGGVGSLGPSGTATGIDGSDAGVVPNSNICSLFLIPVFSGFILLKL